MSDKLEFSLHTQPQYNTGKTKIQLILTKK